MKKLSRRSALFSAGLLSLLGPTRAEAADFELLVSADNSMRRQPNLIVLLSMASTSIGLT